MNNSANNLVFDAELLAERDYWLQRLSGQPDRSRFPTDRARSAENCRTLASAPLRFDPLYVEKVLKLSKGSSFLLFTVLLTALKICLYRYDPHRRVVVGSPAFSDQKLDIQPNALAIVDQLTDTQSFRNLLEHVRKTLLDAYARQNYPYHRLIRDLGLEGAPDPSPLFDVALVTPDVHTDFPDVGHNVTIKVGLYGEEIHGEIEYDTTVLDAETVQRFSHHWLNILEAGLTAHDRNISDLAMLDQAERHQLLVEWNGTRAAHSTRASIQQWFEAQAERTPDAIAAVFEEDEITYRELNARANQLAHHLQSLGVGPESRVGICLERSLEMIVTIVGVLKAGGAYVPLDPTYPRERLAFMVEDAALGVIVTHSSLAATSALEDPASGNPTSNCRGPKAVFLDPEADTITQASRDDPVNNTEPWNAAYVIYTSGSTGTPKGVLVSHHNVLRLFAATDPWYRFTSADVWTLFHSYAFDFSVWEIWGPLLYGGRLVVVSQEVSRSPEAFSRLLTGQQTTVLNQTPAAFRQLSETITGAHALRLVIFGGEALNFRSLRPWFERNGDSTPQLFNMYGITETTVHVTSRPLAATDTVSSTMSLIGRGIPDLRLYLLDPCQRLVPIGAPAEIHVGGAGVTRGYLNRPDLTAERFLPDSYAAPGDRLYRTGDRARFLVDGDIEYLGRLDHQVKIRGFRIELGEIESALTEHPGIREAVVLVQPEASDVGEQHLVSYAVLERGSSTTVTDLRRFLLTKLPEYLVPGQCILLDTLPLTATGKVDRRALPNPGGARPELEGKFIAPRTSTEAKLAEIWEETFGIDKIGVRDNFFELGGHSLLAMRLMDRIQKHYQAALPVARLFEEPTIEKLAQLLTHNEAEETSSLVTIHARGSLPPFFCVHPVQGTVLSYYNLSRHLGPDQRFYGLEAQGLHERPPVYRSVEAMAAHYIELLREFQPQGPYHIGGWSAGGVIAYEMAQQLQRSGARVASLALIDSYAPDGTSERETKTAEVTTLLERLGLEKEEMDRVGGLEPEARVALLLKHAQEAGLVPEEISLNHALLAWHIMNATMKYQPVPYHAETLLLKASESPFHQDPTNGWSVYIGRLDIRSVPGTHYTMFEEPNVAVLASELARFLNSH